MFFFFFFFKLVFWYSLFNVNQSPVKKAKSHVKIALDGEFSLYNCGQIIYYLAGCFLTYKTVCLGCGGRGKVGVAFLENTFWNICLAYDPLNYLPSPPQTTGIYSFKSRDPHFWTTANWSMSGIHQCLSLREWNCSGEKEIQCVMFHVVAYKFGPHPT